MPCRELKIFMQATYAKDGKKVNFVIPSSLDLHMSDKYFVCVFWYIVFIALSKILLFI